MSQTRSGAIDSRTCQKRSAAVAQRPNHSRPSSARSTSSLNNRRAECVRLQKDAITVTGSRWTCTTRTSGKTMTRGHPPAPNDLRVVVTVGGIGTPSLPEPDHVELAVTGHEVVEEGGARAREAGDHDRGSDRALAHVGAALQLLDDLEPAGEDPHQLP